MVTKPTGRPRGRPRKPKPPPHPRGGQPLAFLEDPDRYWVALMDAFLALANDPEFSERNAAIAAASWEVGQEGDAPRPSADHPGLVVTNWLRNVTRRRARAGTLDGRAATLRKKYRAACAPDEAAWRVAMAGCFMLAIGARVGRKPETAKAAILARAEAIGEADFAREVLFPMIASKFGSGSPDFSGIRRSTTPVG